MAASKSGAPEENRKEKQFQLLVEAVEEYAIFLLNPEGRVTTWNAGAEKIKGYTKDEILGKHFSVFYPAEDVAANKPKEALEIAVREGQWTDEGWRVSKDGSHFWAQVTITSVYDEEGELQGFAKITRDMTERERAREELRESEAKFRILSERALVGIAMLQDGLYTYVNSAFANIFGYASEEIVGQSPERLFHPDDWPEVREWVRRRLEGELQEAHYKARGVTKKGKIRHVEVHGSRILYQGTPTILGTVVDITEHRRLQDELKDLSSKLTMAEQKERRRIAQVLHDDLQQRLYGIQMKMALLRRHVESGKRAKLLEQVSTAEKLMAEAVATTRQLSVDLSPPVLKADGLTDALGWLKTQMAELYGLEVELEAKRPFYLPNENQRVLLFQIVRELLLNVVKHADAEQATVELTDVNGQMVIRVIDEGRGFDPDALPSDEENPAFGLRAARERLELFGGRLDVDSAPGQGTRVVVHAPLEFYQAESETSDELRSHDESSTE